MSNKDLNIIKPNQPTTTCSLTEGYDTVHHLSSSHVLLASSNRLIIYDIIYGTIQAELDQPNLLSTIISTHDLYSFHAIVNAANKTLAIPLTIPETATLLDAINKEQVKEVSITNPPLLVGSKVRIQQKEGESPVEDLFRELKSAVDAKDATKFDKLYKAFRKRYQVAKKSAKKTTNLTPSFTKELLSLIFVKETEGVSMKIYPESTIKSLLQINAFSRDLLPGGAGGLVSAALTNAGFLKRLLKNNPTPFTYRDYLVLIKYILDTPESKRIISSSKILDAFERDADTFFDRPDMRTVLSITDLQLLLSILTREPETIPYPTILCGVLDSIGLGPLLLTQSLSTDVINVLQTTLENESNSISTCLQTSSLLSLLLQRQNDIPTSQPQDRSILFNDKKRKLGKTGWLEVVAQEGGMTKQRRAWMKKPPLPGSGRELTSRFVATTKFQEAPIYSLDRMAI